MDCLFCKIAAGEIPAQKAYEDDSCIAFRDIHPQAPAHFLVIPRRHIASVAHTTDADKELLGHLTLIATQLAKQQALTNGFRIVMNSGEEGGQTVHHLHLHVLGGRQMHWPPG
jgi:histidine triad (HIT) family protein